MSGWINWGHARYLLVNGADYVYFIIVTKWLKAVNQGTQGRRKCPDWPLDPTATYSNSCYGKQDLLFITSRTDIRLPPFNLNYYHVVDLTCPNIVTWRSIDNFQPLIYSSWLNPIRDTTGNAFLINANVCKFWWDSANALLFSGIGLLV